jgi:hypothetical protein
MQQGLRPACAAHCQLAPTLDFRNRLYDELAVGNGLPNHHVKIRAGWDRLEVIETGAIPGVQAAQLGRHISGVLTPIREKDGVGSLSGRRVLLGAPNDRRPPSASIA